MAELFPGLLEHAENALQSLKDLHGMDSKVREKSVLLSWSDFETVPLDRA